MTDRILPIPLEALDDCGVLLGRRGAGKSNALMTLFEHELDEGHRSVMVDPKGDRWGVRFNPDGSPSRFDIPILGGPKAEIKLDEYMGDTVGKMIATHNFSCLIDLSEMHLAAQQRFMLDFAATLYRYNRDPITLFLEEIDQFANQDQRYQPPKLVHHVANLSSLGRQRGIIVWMASQRAAKVNKNLLNMIDTMVAMGARAPLDRKAISDWFAGHSTEAAKAVGEQLGSMKPGEAFAWIGNVDYFERVTFPMASTFDSGRRPKHGEKPVELKLPKLDMGEMQAALESAGMEAVDEADPEIVQAQAAEISRLKARVDELEPAAAELVQAKQVAAELAGREARLFDGIQRIADEATALLALHQDLEISVHSAPSSPAPVKVEAPAKAPAAPPPPPAPLPSAGVVAGTVTKPQQKILNSIAWAETYLRRRSLDRGIIAFLADASPKSSGYQNNLGSLRTMGLIDYPQKGELQLTDVGRGIAERPQAALTSDAFLDAIAAKLRPGIAEMLRRICADYPRVLTRTALAEKLDKSPSSSGFQNDLGFLRSLGVIEYPQSGEVRAASFIFGE